LALTTLLLVIVSCGGSDSGSDAPVDADFVAPTGIAGEIAKVVCEPLTSLWQKSGSENKDSWQCKRDDKQVDFDVYVSEEEKQQVSDEALTLLGTTGSEQTWADTPILCGTKWTMGVADLKTRDALIDALNAAGVTAATC
ncbi:MAG: hypothetical protein EB142_07750, partial [Actinobacteria bacterium]|nr:hypothetical protein [Actinomycetota bacterium]